MSEYRSVQSLTCEVVGCQKTLRYHTEDIMPRTTWQHGDNPEHVKVVDHFIQAVSSEDEYRAMLVDWLNRIHEYERA